MSQQPTATAHHIIPTCNGRYGDKGHYDAQVLVVMGCRVLCIGGWRAEGEGRIVDQGPIVPGPHAYAYLRASVLSDSRDADEDGRRRINVADGDTLDIAGTVYRIRRVDHYGNAVLDLV